MPFNGPGFGQLDSLIAACRQAETTIKSAVSTSIAAESLKILQEEHTEGTGPDSAPWKADGRNPPLTKTRNLRDHWQAAPTENGVRVTNDVVYAGIQQNGGKTGRGRKGTIPARPMVPGDVLPPRWESRFKTATEQALEGLLGGDK